MKRVLTNRSQKYYSYGKTTASNEMTFYMVIKKYWLHVVIILVCHNESIALFLARLRVIVVS